MRSANGSVKKNSKVVTMDSDSRLNVSFRSWDPLSAKSVKSVFGFSVSGFYLRTKRLAHSRCNLLRLNFLLSKSFLLMSYILALLATLDGLKSHVLTLGALNHHFHMG